MFYDKFKLLCGSVGISCNKAALAMGLSNATPTKWKKTGATPDGSTIAKLTTYFGIPSDFLLERPPFDYWDLINENRKRFLQCVDIDPDMLQIIWGIDSENPDSAPIKDFISFLSLAVESAHPTSEGDWDITLKPSFQKEKMPAHKGEQGATNIFPLPKTYSVPLLGNIACGRPILAVEQADETVEVPDFIKADFALRCKGDSMINARIFDGDIVYIHSQPEVENGQIAAIRIGDEATLKKVYYNGQRLILRAANPLYTDLEYEGDTLSDVEILGKAVAFTSMLPS